MKYFFLFIIFVTSFSIVSYEEAFDAVSVRVEKLNNDFFKEEVFPQYGDGSGMIKGEGIGWTGGFWCGMNWYHYLRNPEDANLERARIWTDWLLQEAQEFDTHDLGFLYHHSAVLAYELTGDKEYKLAALDAADRLLERMHPEAGVITLAPRWNDQTSADTTANLPLLAWAYDISGDKQYKEGIQKHLSNALPYLIREDDSTYHAFSFDLETGEVLWQGSIHNQGYSDESCWSRGHFWLAFGLLRIYQYGFEEYVDIARELVEYALEFYEPGKLLWYDFKDPDPQWKDSSAVVLMAYCLQYLSEIYNDQQYQQKADEMIQTVISTSLDIDKASPSAGVVGNCYYRQQQPEIEGFWGTYYFYEYLWEYGELEPLEVATWELYE